MKKALIIFYFFSLFLTVEEQVVHGSENRVNAIRVYLCSRLTEAAKQWNLEISKELEGFEIFFPQKIDLRNATADNLDKAIFQADFEGMQNSDILLVLPPYGRDCAWEMGWFCGQKKPAIAYVETEGDWLRDAMVKGGLAAIITNNAILYQTLLKDAATVRKTHFVSSKRDLGNAIKEIFFREYHKN